MKPRKVLFEPSANAETEDGMLTAGEQKGQAKIVATPRVTTLNNRKAEIESGTQIPVVTTQNSGNNTGSVVFTTQYVSVPLRLEVTPQITDLGTVVLERFLLGR